MTEHYSFAKELCHITFPLDCDRSVHIFVFFWSGYSEYVFVSEKNNDKIIVQIFSATVF